MPASSLAIPRRNTEAGTEINLMLGMPPPPRTSAPYRS
jgi:hypothetical protein